MLAHVNNLHIELYGDSKATKDPKCMCMGMRMGKSGIPWVPWDSVFRSTCIYQHFIFANGYLF